MTKSGDFLLEIGYPVLLLLGVSLPGYWSLVFFKCFLGFFFIKVTQNQGKTKGNN